MYEIVIAYRRAMLDADLTILIVFLSCCDRVRTSGESVPLVQESEESKFKPIPFLLRRAEAGDEFTSSCKAL